MKKKVLISERCAVAGCDRKMAVVKHKLCKAHANRYYCTGKLGTGIVPKKKRYKPIKWEK
jgi:hypothetical protein